jgi:hypothetical protein
MEIRKMFLGLALFAVLPLGAQKNPVYLDKSKPIEERVEDALHRLTLKEKLRWYMLRASLAVRELPDWVYLIFG